MHITCVALITGGQWCESRSSHICRSITAPTVPSQGRRLHRAPSRAARPHHWLLIILPVLAFTASAAFLSVATRNSAAGVVIPVFIALAMSLLGALNGVSELRHYLLTTQFEAFHTPRYDAQVFRALWVSAIYLHCRAPHRRTHPLSPARHHRRMTRRRRHLTALALSDLAAAAGSGCSSTTDFTSAKMARDIAPTYVNYLRLQQTTEGHAPPAAPMVSARCGRGGRVAGSTGAGYWPPRWTPVRSRWPGSASTR